MQPRLPEIHIASRTCIAVPALPVCREARMSEAATVITAAPGRLLRRREVEQETGLSRTSIYRLMDQGQFPRPLRTGTRAVAWPTSVIEAWKASRQIAMAGEI